MRRFKFKLILLTVIAAVFAVSPALADQDPTTEERIRDLSTQIEELNERLDGRQGLSSFLDKISISGLIEAEAGYSKYDPDAAGESSEESSDIILSTVELGIDMNLNDYVSGHLLFLWEEEDTEPVDLDEGFIVISGGDKLPVYASIGKFYIPFGNFESNFISDPLTLELGETRESALLIGYLRDHVELSAGAFNGDVEELGKDDHINGYFASVSATVPGAVLLPGMEVTTGASYISNIADSDMLTEVFDESGADGIEDAVGGVSAYLSAIYRERIYLMAEYLGALDEFEPGELGAFGGREPSAWLTELIYAFDGGYGLGVKYEGTDDAGDVLAEERYGAIAFCQPFENTYIGLEVLQESFENGDDSTAVTAQVAYSF